MTQIWLFASLLIILQLSGVIESSSIINSNESEDYAYYNSLHRGEAVEKENRCYGSDNSPIFYENCFYPYPDNVPHGCHRYVLFGNRTKKDKLLFKQEYKKKELTPTVLTIRPELKNINFEAIRFVAVDDFNGSECIHEDKVCVTKGGIGQKSIEIIIENGTCNTRGYRVALYGE